MKREHYELWRRFKLLDDAEARDALIEAHTPLVKRVVDRMNISPMAYMDRDDLIAQAFIGLIDAMEKCDLDRCEQFEAYAYARVRGAVIDGIREMDWVPRTTRRAAGLVENTRARLNATLCRSATDEEVAQALDMEVEKVQGVIGEIEQGSVLSLDDPLGSHADSVTRLDTVAHPSSPDPQGQVDLIAKRQVLARAIDQLQPNERIVISLYYHEELTLKEIGLVLDLTEARVCQIRKAALKKIRALLDAEQDVFLAA